MSFTLEHMRLISATLDTSHFGRSLLNDASHRNMLFILVTYYTSHFEMPLLNDAAYATSSDVLHA